MKKFLWHYKRAKRDRQGARFLWRSFLHYAYLSSFIVFERKGVRLYCHRDPFSFWLWNHKDELRSDELFFEAYLQPGDTVVDAGANIGLLTLRAAAVVGAQGKVVSIEPHPETHKWLRKNIALNLFSNITVHNVAVGHKKETIPFTNFRIKDVNKISEKEGTLLLPMTTVDDLCSDISHCHLFKIDVEGFELPTLFGAESFLKRTDLIVFESSPRNFGLQNYTLQDVFRYLALQGFSVYMFDEYQNPQLLESDYETMPKYENLFATRDISIVKMRLAKK